jgi:hypothetical protein
MNNPGPENESHDELDLSVIIRVVGGGIFLRKCLQALLPQIADQLIEIIVPYDPTVWMADELKKEFTQVVFLQMQDNVPDISSAESFHKLYDLRTAAGLRIARGKIVALVEDYSVPTPDWCDQVIEAHKLPYPVVGGAVEHSNHNLLNWAIYFLDFGRYQLPFKEGPAEYLTDVNISYKREALNDVRAVWEKRYNEIQVNAALTQSGMTLWKRPQIVVRQDRGQLTWKNAIPERFYWGKIFGQVRAQCMTIKQRMLLLAAMPIMPLLLVWRVIKKGLTGKRNHMTIMRSIPLMLVLAFFWCTGETAGYLQGRYA